MAAGIHNAASSCSPRGAASTGLRGAWKPQPQDASGVKFQKASLSTGWAARFLALGGEGTPSPSFNRRYGALRAEQDGNEAYSPLLPPQ